MPLYSKFSQFSLILPLNENSLTEGEMDVIYASASHAGDRIAYVAATIDLNPIITDLFVFDLKRGEHIKLTESNMTIGARLLEPRRSIHSL